jgi:hypothetical protein
MRLRCECRGVLQGAVITAGINKIDVYSERILRVIFPLRVECSISKVSPDAANLMKYNSREQQFCYNKMK